jgi:hypothetical protein
MGQKWQTYEVGFMALVRVTVWLAQATNILAKQAAAQLPAKMSAAMEIIKKWGG